MRLLISIEDTDEGINLSSLELVAPGEGVDLSAARITYLNVLHYLKDIRDAGGLKVNIVPFQKEIV